MMDEQLRRRFAKKRKSLIEESDWGRKPRGVVKIIDGDDVERRGKVESEKSGLSRFPGELDKRTGNKKKSEAPRPADAIATSR